jgi:TM2 domain-containing membrane protein YozV
MKLRIVAILLCLFLGGLGIHQFYLNKNNKGLWYFFFCWTLIPVLLAVYDLGCLFILTDEEFNKKYNSKIHP